MFSKSHIDTILTWKIIPFSRGIPHVQGLRLCTLVSVWKFIQKTLGHLQRSVTNLHIRSAKWTSVWCTFAQSLFFFLYLPMCCYWLWKGVFLHFFKSFTFPFAFLILKVIMRTTKSNCIFQRGVGTVEKGQRKGRRTEGIIQSRCKMKCSEY